MIIVLLLFSFRIEWLKCFVIFMFIWWFMCVELVVLIIGIRWLVISVLFMLCLLISSWFSLVGMVFGFLVLNVLIICCIRWWYVMVVSGVFFDGFYMMVLLYMRVSVVFYDYIVIGKLNVEMMFIMFIGCYVFIIWCLGCLLVMVRLCSCCDRLMVKL